MWPSLCRSKNIGTFAFVFTVPECPGKADRVTSQDTCNEEGDPCRAAEDDHNFDSVAEGKIWEEPQVEQENADLREPSEAYVDVGENVEVFQCQCDVVER